MLAKEILWGFLFMHLLHEMRVNKFHEIQEVLSSPFSLAFFFVDSISI